MLNFNLNSGTACQIFARAQVQTVPAGSEVCRQGDHVTHVFLLEPGLCGLTFTSEEGRELIVDIRRPGWIIGAPSAILHRLLPVSAIAFERTRFRLLAKSAFLDSISAEAGPAAWHLIQMQSLEIHDHIDRIVSLAILNVRERVEKFFWDSAATNSGERCRVRVPLSQEELARYCVSTRQHLSRVLKDLRQDDIITRSGAWYVLDRAKLRHRRASHPTVSLDSSQ